MAELSVRAHLAWLAAPHASFAELHTLLVPWAVQFVMSWVGFLIFASWDYDAHRRGALVAEKLPSRHPLHVSPARGAAAATDAAGRLALWPELLPRALCPRVSVFWYSQLFMVPLVLFNQLVVWPLVSLLCIVPTWARTAAPLGAWGPWGVGALATMLPLMLVSDQLWYWSHRLMHTPWAWTHLHKMHHVAPQCAVSATYVHPLEYALFTLSLQIPFALVGFPAWVFCVPMGWGMVTGSGAHSGYAGDFANGEKHGTGHHLYHSANFGLLMVADVIWGTHWSPGDPCVGGRLAKLFVPRETSLSPAASTFPRRPPRAVFSNGKKIGDDVERSFTAVSGSGAEEAVAALKTS